MDARLIRRVKRRDRIANGVITGGGIFVIVCVLGILVLIAKVALPLFYPPSARILTRYPVPGAVSPGEIVAVGMDEYLETAFVLDRRGEMSFFRVHDGTLLDTAKLPSPSGRPGPILAAEGYGRLHYSLLWEDGGLGVASVEFRPQFDEAGRRTIEHRVTLLAGDPPRPGREAPRAALARFDEERGFTRVLVHGDGRVEVRRQVVSAGLLGGGSVEEVSTVLEEVLPGAVTAITATRSGTALYVASDTGHLLRWDLADPQAPRLVERIQAFGDGRAATALELVLGERTLLVGDSAGGLTGWLQVQGAEGGDRRLTEVKRLERHAGRVIALEAAHQGKMIASLDDRGTVHLDHLTNERHLVTLAGETALDRMSLTTRDNGLIGIGTSGQIQVWQLRIPHPEASWGTYFGEIWYESFPEPAYVWQSSAGTDDFESKLSLVPLIAGTLKGAFYGMLFAVPLAVLSAMYSSHLMHPRLRRYIKPTFEIMGSVPTVVIGFLAALWLAPIVKLSMTAFFLMLGTLPATAVGGAALFEWLGRRGLLRQSARGYEFLLMIPLVVVGVWLTFQAGWLFDRYVLGTSLPTWLFDTLNVRVDQRNAIIIAIALGFAVLPTVFTLSDDALTNVPRNLTAASLALGATRWQTVTRVVLPSASPGVFAALMVGLGRAVGETMIVLMATGNTPILDWSVFNGMRTLSANIAVEIPEAPLDGTLYRTLFLSGVLLFVTTFLLNSVAEVVRIRLRKKFGQY